MRKILLITASLRVGGAEKVAKDIGLYGSAAGFEIDYLVFGDAVGDYEPELIQRGCKVIHFPSPSANYVQYYKSLKKLIHENNYSVVHAHTMFNAGWAMLAARQEGVPIRIAHAHSALKDGRNYKKQAYEHVMRRLILCNATDLVACGDAAGIRLFGKSAYEKRGQCILNGIDVGQFAFNQEARTRIRADLHISGDFVIGHVGHLAADKNQAFLIRMMPQILERKPNAKLLMLGDGEDRAMLHQLIHDRGLDDCVVMTGNVSNVSDYLSAMDVFAFPSLYEGMPLSIVEVQANGLPCILSTGVPKDVYLTDLIKPLPLTEPERWIEEICKAVRFEPEIYAAEIRRQGLDINAVMQQYMKLYERAEKY